MLREELDSLHDAVLVDLRYRWSDTSLVITIKQWHRIVELGASLVTDLTIPHEEPWGPSGSIYKVGLDAPADGTQRLEIQMQSGDVIGVTCRAVTFRVVSSREP